MGDLFGSFGSTDDGASDDETIEEGCDEATGECEQEENVITDDGFFNEDGEWQDMTNYVEDPKVTAAITQAMATIGSAAKIGKSAIAPG